MSTVKDIDLKIAELKKKKEALQTKLAQHLLKKMQEHAQTELSPETLLGFFMDTWHKPTLTEQQKWQDLGVLFFRKTSSAKTKKTDTTLKTTQEQAA